MSKAAPCFLVHKIEQADQDVIRSAAGAYMSRGMGEKAAFIRATEDAIDTLQDQKTRIEREAVAAFEKDHPDAAERVLDRKKQDAEADTLAHAIGNAPVDVAISEAGARDTAPTEDRVAAAPADEMADLKAQMGDAIGELASLLGAKLNMTPEEEAKIIPIMSKIFRVAAKMGYLKFQDAARYVMAQIRQLAGDVVADKLSIDNLQAGYINVAKEIGGNKREAMAFDSIDELLADTQAKIDAATHNAASSPQNDKPAPTQAQAEAGNYAKGHITLHGLNLSIENPSGSARTNLSRDQIEAAKIGAKGGELSDLSAALMAFDRYQTKADPTALMVAISMIRKAGNWADATQASKNLSKSAWAAIMPNGVNYGYIKRSTGADGDHVDVFVGPHPDETNAWIINQRQPVDAEPNDANAKFDEHKVMLGFKSGDEAVAAYLLGFEDKFGAQVFQSVSPSMSIQELKDVLPALVNSDPVSADATPEFLAVKPNPEPVEVQDDKGEHVSNRKLVTAAPEIEYTTKNGKVLKGVIATIFKTKESAREVDKFTWRMNGGYFIRMAHVTRPKAKPSIVPSAPNDSATSATPNKPNTISTDDGRFAVAGLISQAFVDGTTFATILEARKFITELTGEQIEPGTEHAKLADETIEAGVVLAARKIVEIGHDNGVGDETIFDSLLNLYKAQPNLSMRSSESIREQAYSTPVPMAFIASRLAGIGRDSVVYEPTAGNGVLLIEAVPGNVIANELNQRRAAMLKRVLVGATIRANNAAAWKPGNGDASAVIMNPPFGAVKGDDGETIRYEPLPGYETNEVDHAIVFNSLDAMADDGKAVLIVGGILNANTPEGRRNGYRGKSKREFYYFLYQHYNVTGHYSIDGDLYSKQGAKYPVDMVTINGRGKSKRGLPAADLPTEIKTYGELKELLNERDRVVSEGHGDSNRVDGSMAETGNQDQRGGVAIGPRGSGGQPAVGGVRGGSDASGEMGVQPAGSSKPGQPRSDRPVHSEGEPGVANPVQSGGHRPRPVRGNGDAGNRRPDSDGGNELPVVGRTSGLATKPAQSGLTQDRRGLEKETEHQVTYEPRSSAPAIGTLVPIAMRDAVQDAISRIEADVGNLDSYVAESLKMDIGHAKTVFSAEQIDALAMGIYNAQHESGFIIGDQTGVGKGRVVAAMIRYALVNGHRPIFVTDKPNLYTDMIRDLDDIGMADTFGLDHDASGIFITRRDGDPIPYTLTRTRDGEIVEESHSLRAPKIGNALDAVMTHMMQDGSVGEYKAIFTTYSQMQNVNGKVTTRQEFLEQFAKGNFIIFDESHQAGGAGGQQARSRDQREQQKQTGSVHTGRSGFARKLIASSGGTFFSSATYAKRPDSMDLYSSTNMMLAVDKPSELTEAIKRGGVPMQQAVATMLTIDGQYIRRERTFAGVTYDTRAAQVDLDTANNMSSAMRGVLKFSRLREAAIKALKKSLDASGAAVSFEGEKTQVAGANFGAIMHNLIGQMLLSLKAVDSVKYAIERSNRGEKVVLTVANTMGSFLSDYAKDVGISIGDPVSLSFADLYQRYLEKQRWVRVKSPGAKESVPYYLTDADLGPGLVGLYDGIRKQIADSGFGAAPISPIDYMHSELRKAKTKGLDGVERAITTDEITGRTVTLDYGADGIHRLGSRAATIKKRLGAINGFNSGDIDILIVNQSGSTGLSLHASSKFRDQRKRHMVLVQPEANIDTHMQMLGRIHRTGQVIEPAYTQMMANIPAESRPAAILMKKMGSLNANTTASKKSSVMADGVTDFMNDYGGQVAMEYLRDNPDVHKSIGGSEVIDLKENPEDGNESDIRKMTGYIPILPIAKQEEVYADLVERYKDLIERENDMGTNKLEAKALDLDAETLKSETITADKGVDSVFSKPATMELVSVKRTVKPYSSKEIRDMISERLAGDSGDAIAFGMRTSMNLRITDYAKERLNTLLEGGADQARLASEQALIANMQNHVNAVLSSAVIGDTVRLTNRDGIILHGAIIDVIDTQKTKNPAAGSAWKMVFALANGESKKLTLSLTQVGGSFKMEKEQRVDHLNPETGKSSYVEAMSLFDSGVHSRRENRWMITGNLLAGYAKHPGQVVSYTKSDGTTSQGIFMPRQFDFEEVKASSDVLIPADKAIQFFSDATGSSGQRNGSIGTMDNSLIIQSDGGGYAITTTLSKRGGGKWYADVAFTDILGEQFFKHGARMEAYIDSDERLRAALDYLSSRAGESLYAKNHIDVAKRIMGIGVQASIPVQGGVAQEERAVYAVNESDPHTGDLFGHEKTALPDLQRKVARRKPTTRDGNLHAAATLSVRESAEVPGLYLTTTQLVTVGQRALPLNKVNTVGDAAQVFAYLSKYAVEHFDALVTDNEGSPLAVIGSFKGATAQTSVYPGTIMGELSRIHGAAHVWMAHNHPSGLAELSSVDRHLSSRLDDLMRGSGITYHGLLVMATRGDRVHYEDTSYRNGDVSASQKPLFSVPIVERMIASGGSVGNKLTNPSEAAINVIELAKGDPGIVFANAQNQITAYVPFDAGHMGELRKDGRLMRLVRAASLSGAESAIIAMPDGKVSRAAFANVKSALEMIDIKTLDGIEYVTDGQGSQAEGTRAVSLAEQNAVTNPDTVNTRTSAMDAAINPVSMRAPEVAGNFKTITQKQAEPPIVPGAMERFQKDLAALKAGANTVQAKDVYLGSTMLSRAKWYSPLSQAIEGAPAKVFSNGTQVKNWLMANTGKSGIKLDELNWSGLLDYLELRGKDKVTKAEIADYLSGNGVVVNTVERVGVGDLNGVIEEIDKYIGTFADGWTDTDEYQIKQEPTADDKDTYQFIDYEDDNGDKESKKVGINVTVDNFGTHEGWSKDGGWVNTTVTFDDGRKAKAGAWLSYNGNGQIEVDPYSLSDFGDSDEFTDNEVEAIRDSIDELNIKQETNLSDSVQSSSDEFDARLKEAIVFLKDGDIYSAEARIIEAGDIEMEYGDNPSARAIRATISVTGDANKYSSYWGSSYKGGIPGSYRETLVTLPQRDPPAANKEFTAYQAELREKYGNGESVMRNATPDEIHKLDELGAPIRESRVPAKQFRSPHWDEKNVLVHLRTDKVIGDDGKRYLRVGEIQSDFGQLYKKQRDAIKSAVDADFQGIIDKMKATGVLEVAC